MYFLLAVALWICVAYILKSGKSQREKSQKAQSEWFDKAQKEHSRFMELYTASDELLSKTQHLVYSSNDEACIMCRRIECEAGVNPTSDMTVRALLAQNCKMPKASAYSGLRSSPCGQIDMEIERKFLIWYDKELRINGFPHKLLFTPWNKKTELRAGDISVAVPVSEHPEMTSGVYFWEPIRAFASGGENIITQESSLAGRFSARAELSHNI